jgi:hypothetical protein
MNKIGMIVAGLLLALMAASSTLYVVDQRQFAVVYALGEIKEVITEPGLKFKMPPPFQNVVFLDKRVQSLDSPETRPIFTAEKKSLVIDSCETTPNSTSGIAGGRIGAMQPAPAMRPAERGTLYLASRISGITTAASAAVSAAAEPEMLASTRPAMIAT